MRLKDFMWLALLSCLWGPSFLFIKMAVVEIPPLTLVTGRVGLAAALLYLILRAQGQRLPRFGRVWGHFAIMGRKHPFKVIYGTGRPARPPCVKLL